MEKLTIADIKGPEDYEKVRADFRRRVIELKERRRFLLGDRVSLTFENRDTALSQIQEMVRTERLVDKEKIQFEIDTYNALIPGPGELSATLFIEITDAADIRTELDRFIGLDGAGMVFFEVGGEGRVEGRFEKGHSNAARISAVHYVKFPFTDPQRDAFHDMTRRVALRIDHPSYRHETILSNDLRGALSEDLRSR